jgi:hypothetical protein
MRSIALAVLTAVIACIAFASTAHASAPSSAKCSLTDDGRFPAVSNVARTRSVSCANLQGLVDGIKDGFENRSRLPSRVRVFDTKRDRYLTFRCRYRTRQGSEAPYKRASCVRLSMRVRMDLTG